MKNKTTPKNIIAAIEKELKGLKPQREARHKKLSDDLSAHQSAREKAQAARKKEREKRKSSNTQQKQAVAPN